MTPAGNSSFGSTISVLLLLPNLCIISSNVFIRFTNRVHRVEFLFYLYIYIGECINISRHISFRKRGEKKKKKMVEREGAGYLLLFDWSDSLETSAPASLSLSVYTPSFREEKRENGTVTLQIGAPHAPRSLRSRLLHNSSSSTRYTLLLLLSIRFRPFALRQTCASAGAQQKRRGTIG